MNHFENNSCTHLHKDSAPEGYVHIRANVMLKKPQKGGNIIIDEKIYNVEKNDLWLILASIENHGSTPIENGERLIYSFGAIIEKDKINKILKEREMNLSRNFTLQELLSQTLLSVWISITIKLRSDRKTKRSL